MRKKLLILTCIICVFALFSCNSTPQQTTTGRDTEVTEKNSAETTNAITDTHTAQTTEASAAETGENSETEITEITTEKTLTESTAEATEESATNEPQETSAAEPTDKPIVETSENLSVETTEAVTTEETTTEEDQSAHVVLEASKTELSPGEEFTITISIKNNPGIFSFTFAIPIDNSIFEFVSASRTESICASFGICNYDTNTLSYKFNGYSSSPFENILDDGEIVTITLKVKDSAVPGEYALSVSLDHKNIINVDAVRVDFNGDEVRLSVSN